MEIQKIIFRGKRVDNGEWVYGYYSFDNRPTSRGTYITCYSGYSQLDYEVIPETVGQYTGLTDKNGKKIFEGDIVFKRTYQGKKPMNVYFASGQFTCGVGGGSSTPSHYYTLDDKQVEIIGNIFDNPELMKE